MRRFEGRAVAVTGASSGIGLAVAERLAAEGAGLCLAAAAADAADLDLVAERLRAAPTRVTTVVGDISDPDTSDRIVRASLADLGQLDGLVANAGIGEVANPLETPLDQYDRAMETNARGTFLSCMAAARAMASAGRGAIVCTTSSAATLGEEVQVAYNASKAAIAALVRSLAVGLAPHGIRVNAVAPGWVRTRATVASLNDPSEWAQARTRIPLDRPAEPSEIAGPVAFLLSDDASYTTGAVLACDGGLTAGLRTSGWSAAGADAGTLS